MAETPYGFCECGCGERTTISRQNSSHWGWVKGEPKRYVNGHQHRAHQPIADDPQWTEEDRGYETPCWIWQHGRSTGGYGRIKIDGKTLNAHRWMYEQRVGPIPNGLEIDHLCHVKDCVNPDHLEPVTQLVNLRRRRSLKLSGQIVTEIRASSESASALGERFGVHPRHIMAVRSGKSWA